MSKFEIKLPKMGESVAEATLTAWLKEIGDSIDFDEAIVEIATDKVDSEVPSEKKGILIEKCFQINDIIKVGETIAIIETDEEESDNSGSIQSVNTKENESNLTIEENVSKEIEGNIIEDIPVEIPALTKPKNVGFLSPLVRKIIKSEKITDDELRNIPRSGKNNRITKNDILSYLDKRNKTSQLKNPVVVNTSNITNGDDQIIEMSKMGKLISQHMTDSIKISAHVQSFIEADVTNIVNWRNRLKKSFEDREGEKFTLTPIFIEAVAAALRQYPMLNISIKDEKIIVKKNINIGMATALNDDKLIVPVIKNADQLNLVGIAKTVNDLANRARNNNLNPDDIAGGTYTLTNVGIFGSIMGTPIINQPQVGILAFGTIRKMPSVIETEKGDFIGIRSKIILSHSYDHRVVNGSLGSKFVKFVKEYLENWDTNREI
ncbi:MAG: dihydrolipoamide acetyltransferase family protein [Flavobacteriaceae bacterium]